MTTHIGRLSSQTLRKAAALQLRIETLTRDLERILGGAGNRTKPGTTRASTSKPKRKRKLSAAGRARIAAAMKKRWAKAKAAGKNAL